GLPILHQRILYLLGSSAFIGDDVRVPTLLRRRQHLGIFRNRPEIFHHLHRLIECFVVRGSLTEFLGCQNFGVTGIAAEFTPLLLHILANEPLAKFEALIALLGVAHNRKPLSAQRSEALSGRTSRHGKIASNTSVLVRSRVGQSREECKEI